MVYWLPSVQLSLSLQPWKKVALRIVESEKPSKGKLYFNCEKGGCRFFAWCYPISGQYGIRETIAERNLDGNGIAGAGRHVVDDNQEWLKIVIMGLVILSVVHLFVTIASTSKK